MSTLKQLRDSHRVITAAQFDADDNRPVDLEFYPNAIVHAYDWRFSKTETVTYYIIEQADGFHFTFTHPCDEIAATLADAEKQLHAFPG